jgi:hypothetical protein
MKISSLKTWTAAIAVTFLAAPVYSLTINDAGVVGAASGETGGNANETTATAIANHLLAMGASESDPDPCSLSGTTTCYKTSSTDYNGTLDVADATKVDGGSNDVSGFTWVLAKYDGDNAGFVLFYVPDLGGTTIPLTSSSIWLNVAGQGYQLSNFVGWNGTNVPDGGMTLLLLGAALGGLGAARRFMNV